METARPSSTPSRVNLRSMINLDSIENLLSSLMTRIDEQDVTIERLQSACARFLQSTQVAEENFSNVTANLKKMSLRLDSVQSSSITTVGGKEMTAGELSFLNNMHIQQLNETLMECARRREVDVRFQEVSENNAKDFKELRTWSAPIEMVNRLSVAQHDMGSRISGLEGIVACKLDRSELGHVEALAARLLTYDDFKEETRGQLRDVSLQLSSLETDLSVCTKDVTTLDQQCRNIREQIHGLALKTDVHTLAKEIESQAAAIEKRCTIEYAEKLNKWLAESSSRIGATEELCTLLDAKISSAAGQLATKASLTDVRACVLRSHYDDAVSVLGSEIDTKAPAIALREAEERIISLEKQLEAESLKLAVAMRFVDWFTSRGENYEHNLKVIDKHLHNLVSSSSPSERSPYVGQVRVTPFSSSKTSASTPS
jgi:RNA polymerase-interacting CarD/CdnL/TRCF family regulator